MQTESSSAATGDPWLVACLCAGWCHTCTDYRTTFEALARRRPDLRFAWIDIEDESDVLGPIALDIENFPTLLIARGDALRFYGTVLPHAATLARTVEAAHDAVLTPAVEGLDATLVRRLHTTGERVR